MFKIRYQTTRGDTVMEGLRHINALAIKQKKEWGEILTGFEGKNKYSVADASGAELFFAAEEKGSLLARLFLKSFRPFTISLLAPDGAVQLKVKRPFTFYFHNVDVFGADGKSIGNIKREFSLLRRVYTVKDSNGIELYQLFGPILKPWTFKVIQKDIEVGKIVKKWGGLVKEAVTAADNFAVEFPPDSAPEVKAVLLGAVFLIDFVHFEKKN